MAYLLLQELAETAQDSTLVSEPESVSQLDILLQGGWIIVPIFLLSLLAVYLLIDRLLTYPAIHSYF